MADNKAYPVVLVIALLLILYGVQGALIPNNPPLAYNLILNSSLGSNTSSENLTAYWSLLDIDEDPVKALVTWYRDNASLALLDLPFEGGSTNISTRDYSPFNHSADVSGALWNGTGGYDGFGAYEFNGVDDFINVSDHPALEPTAFTLEVWFKANQLPPDFIKIVSKRGLDSNGYPYVIG